MATPSLNERLVTATQRVLLCHLLGRAAPPLALLPDSGGIFRSFPSTPISIAAQQFLLALRRAEPQELDATRPVTPVNAPVPVAAAAASIPSPVSAPAPAVEPTVPKQQYDEMMERAHNCVSMFNLLSDAARDHIIQQHNGDAPDMSDPLEKLCIELGITHHDGPLSRPEHESDGENLDDFIDEDEAEDRNEEYEDSSYEDEESASDQSSASHVSITSSMMEDDQPPAASASASAAAPSPSAPSAPPTLYYETSDSDTAECRRYHGILKQRLLDAVQNPNRDAHLADRKRAYTYFRRKMKKLGISKAVVEKNINGAKRYATELRASRFPVEFAHRRRSIAPAPSAAAAEPPAQYAYRAQAVEQ